MFANALSLAILMVTLATQQQETTSATEDWRRPARTTPAIGTETQALLEFQGQGLGASKIVQTFPPAVQQRILQRYLDSFTYAIPQQFGRESFL